MANASTANGALAVQFFQEGIGDSDSRMLDFDLGGVS